MSVAGRRFSGIVVLALALALLAGASACGGGGASEADAAAAAAGSVRAVNVEVVEVTPVPFVETVRITGVVRANSDVVVSAEESGVVRRIFVDKGARVRAGQPVLKIDDSVLRPQLEQARAMAQLAEEVHQRRKRLWEEERVGSELAYLQARFEAEQARANHQVLHERLDRTTVRAPISGVLEDRMVEVGTMVSPGVPVLRIVDIDRVKIAAGVPERHAEAVRPGSQVRISFDALGGRVVEDRISFVATTVNEQSRTLPIEIELPNAGYAIKPEMIASLVVPLREEAEALVVPRDALLRVEGGFQVFVVEERGEDTIVRARPVVLGPAQGNSVVVRSGVTTGDRLVVLGQQRLSDGDRVAVVEASGGSR